MLLIRREIVPNSNASGEIFQTIISEHKRPRALCILSRFASISQSGPEVHALDTVHSNIEARSVTFSRELRTFNSK